MTKCMSHYQVWLLTIIPPFRLVARGIFNAVEIKSHAVPAPPIPALSLAVPPSYFLPRAVAVLAGLLSFHPIPSYWAMVAVAVAVAEPAVLVDVGAPRRVHPHG